MCSLQGLWHLKENSRLTEAHMFVAVCNKGLVIMNCGSRSRLAVLRGKALMSKEIRASKGNMSSILLRGKITLHNKNKPNTNSISRPAGECILCVLHSWLFHQLKWPPALILIMFQLLWTSCIWSLFHKTQLNYCWTTKVPGLMYTVKINHQHPYTNMIIA